MNIPQLFAFLAVFLGCWYIWELVRDVKREQTEAHEDQRRYLDFIEELAVDTKEAVNTLSAQVKAMNKEANRDARIIKTRQAFERNRSRKVVKAHKESK